MTVSGLIDAFLEGHVAKLKTNSIDSYRVALGKVRTAHGALKAEALTRAHVAALHSGLADTPYAANRALGAISSMYSWGEDHGHLPEGHGNPARRVTRYREQGRERFLSGEELARLGDALREAEADGVDPGAIAAIRLLALTGARFREILHARWDQVDLERRVLFIADGKTGRRPLHFSAAAQAVLAALPRLAGNPYVISGKKEGAARTTLHQPWARVTRAAGLDGLRIHDLRHSFASFGAGASLGLPIIGKLLGHAHTATTQRYAHLADDPLRRAAETIGRVIDGAMNRSAGADVVKLRK